MIELNDIAYDKGCGSNLVSACYLARQGYSHIQSKNGDFLYFMKGNKLMFAAVQIDEVYYLPTRKYIRANLVTHKPKEYTELEMKALLKYLHVKLGHVNRDKLMKILSKGTIRNIPNIPLADLLKCSFFCKTCALAKSKRMSYRNKVGSKSDEPLHTLHMDTSGKFRVKGVYNQIGMRYVLIVVDDATGYKWTFVLKTTKEVWEKIRTLTTQLENQFSYKIKRIR